MFAVRTVQISDVDRPPPSFNGGTGGTSAPYLHYEPRQSPPPGATSVSVHGGPRIHPFPPPAHRCVMPNPVGHCTAARLVQRDRVSPPPPDTPDTVSHPVRHSQPLWRDGPVMEDGIGLKLRVTWPSESLILASSQCHVGCMKQSPPADEWLIISFWESCGFCTPKSSYSSQQKLVMRHTRGQAR